MSRIHRFAVSHSSSLIFTGTVSPQYLLTFQLTASHTSTQQLLQPLSCHHLSLSSISLSKTLPIRHSETKSELFYFVHDLFGKTQYCDIHVCCISMAAHCTLTNQHTVLCLVMLHTFHTYLTTDKA